ncbi:TPA: hypothetical protein N0F65_011413 [Lagenidium giganteum]|uniref:Aminotransferase class I/classII large domain-containing protein n=1 Tax=Lagenidium giganteum TaxID=4803 RepID=A0AAV2ZD72_9STRA|nr:TPA: hypothetical protein N0F65_011413 [Lagenidium giganteum]
MLATRRIVPRMSRSVASIATTVQSSPYAQTHTTADTINFGIGQPSGSLLPLKLFQDASLHRFQPDQDPAVLQYGAGSGFAGFRRDLAAFLTENCGESVEADNLMITAGNSQAISHAAMVFSQSNKRVFVEQPTYFLSFELFRELGLEISSVQVDAHGLDVDHLEQRLRAGDVPAFVYTIPFFHNPTGAVLPPERCVKLVALARQYGFHVISDEPYNLLAFDDRAYPSLASYDRSHSGRILSLGSFSKILAPGLRLGWAHSSSDTIKRLASIGAIKSGGGQNAVTAALVHSVLEAAQLKPHVRHLQRVLHERRRVLCDSLRAECPGCEFHEPAGGYFVWLRLPRGLDAEGLLATAQQHGVAFTPGSNCLLDNAACAADGGDVMAQQRHELRQHCRLSFAFYSTDEIQAGIRLLGAAIRTHIPHWIRRAHVEQHVQKARRTRRRSRQRRQRRPSSATHTHTHTFTDRMSKSKSKHPLVATLSGSIAGGIETVAIWPMEMIKTNLQLGTMRQHYKGMMAGFRYHVRTDGVVSLYRGMVPVLVGSIPKAGIRFGAFDFFKNQFADHNGNTTALRNLAAGISAGAVEASLTTTPIETIKTKLIGANVGVLQGTRMILATEGIRGMYQGLFATVLKQSSNQGLRFMWFAEFKKRVNPEWLEQKGLVSSASNMSSGQHAIVSLIGGMTAGIFSTMGNNRAFFQLCWLADSGRLLIICHGILFAAFDVLKTRMQGLEASRYRSTFDCAKQIFKQDGIMGFYSGVVPRLGRVIPGQGVIFMSYDTIARFVSAQLEK